MIIIIILITIIIIITIIIVIIIITSLWYERIIPSMVWSFPYFHPMAPWHPRYVNQVALKASLRPQGYGWIPWGNDGEDDGEKMGHDYNIMAIYIYIYIYIYLYIFIYICVGVLYICVCVLYIYIYACYQVLG